jgi:dTDP-4-dehydrorhamnose 3,5-epimerase-like enzyme
MGFESHPTALVETDRVGEGARVGAFVHVMRGASIGRSCVVGSHAVVLEGVSVGDGAVVEPGTIVALDVPVGAVVSGNPCRITGYARPVEPAGVRATRVPRVTLHRMPVVNDIRGALTFGEVGQHVPFEVKRYFMVYDVSSQEIRGEHAHRRLHQFLICVRGSCHAVADDGSTREDFALDHPSLGLYLPPMVWGVQHKHTSDALLLVLASDRYDPADYIRDYAEFLSLVKAG